MPPSSQGSSEPHLLVWQNFFHLKSEKGEEDILQPFQIVSVHHPGQCVHKKVWIHVLQVETQQPNEDHDYKDDSPEMPAKKEIIHCYLGELASRHRRDLYSTPKG